MAAIIWFVCSFVGWLVGFHCHVVKVPRGLFVVATDSRPVSFFQFSLFLKIGDTQTNNKKAARIDWLKLEKETPKRCFSRKRMDRWICDLRPDLDPMILRSASRTYTNRLYLRWVGLGIGWIGWMDICDCGARSDWTERTINRLIKARRRFQWFCFHGTHIIYR